MRGLKLQILKSYGKVLSFNFRVLGFRPLGFLGLGFRVWIGLRTDLGCRTLPEDTRRQAGSSIILRNIMPSSVEPSFRFELRQAVTAAAASIYKNGQALCVVPAFLQRQTSTNFWWTIVPPEGIPRNF